MLGFLTPAEVRSSFMSQLSGGVVVRSCLARGVAIRFDLPGPKNSSRDEPVRPDHDLKRAERRHSGSLCGRHAVANRCASGQRSSRPSGGTLADGRAGRTQ